MHEGEMASDGSAERGAGGFPSDARDGRVLPFGRSSGDAVPAGVPTSQSPGGLGGHAQEPVSNSPGGGRAGKPPRGPSTETRAATSNWPKRLETVLTSAAYLVFGMLVGTVGTFAHRANILVGDAPIWLGCIVAVAAVFLLGLGLRLYLDERLPAWMFLAGVIIAVAALTTPGPGRSVIFPGGELAGPSMWWLYGSAIAAALPALWPSLPGDTGRSHTKARSTLISE